MTLQALIFDVDGTLAETEEAHRAAFNKAFQNWGLPWDWSMDDYRELLKTTGGKERMRAFQAMLPPTAQRLSDEEIAELHKAKTRLYTNILAQGDLPLRDGVRALVAAGRAAGLKLAIATTTSRPNVEALTQCCWGQQAEAVFDVIAAGDEVAQKKPAGDVYALALSRLDLPPEACVAFEDSRNGVLSACAVGLSVIVTPSVYTDTDDFTGAAHVVPSLTAADLGPTGLTHLLA